VSKGPYYDLKQAARYCGYRSAAYFGQLVRDYRVPRRGPNGTRYAESDLDLFMQDPKSFMPARRKKQISFDLQWQ
jgi:hypothetical protein